MLFFVKDISDPLIKYVKDDPVRPELAPEFRVEGNRFISAIVEDQDPHAMVCVSLQDFVPEDVESLSKHSDNPSVAVFYTIWSYRGGAGADLLFKTVDEIKARHPGIKRFVTLSPKTEMARRFHLKNGAVIFRENATTINYEYII
jgi:hypothetical protein